MFSWIKNNSDEVLDGKYFKNKSDAQKYMSNVVCAEKNNWTLRELMDVPVWDGQYYIAVEWKE